MAAELALGVLEGEERAEALRHSLANPAFAAIVRKWQDRLDPLGEGFAEAPPPNLWPSIEARLDAQPRTKEIGQVRFWRNTAALASALAACLVAVIIMRPGAMPEAASPPDQATIAQLAGADGTLLAANLDPGSRLLRIRAVTLPDSTLVPELWIIPADGVPRSLGLFNPDGTTQIVVPSTLSPLLVDGTILAVSLELAEGAPHTAPSTTPIATGKISTI
jgi:anti-sigma-K factor RskA